MGKYTGMVCPLCMTGFKDDDSVIFCPECGIPHHEACWQKNKGCTTVGCSGQYNEVQVTNPTDVCESCIAVPGEGHASSFECETLKSVTSANAETPISAEIPPIVKNEDPFVNPGKKLTKKQIIIGAAALVAVIVIAIVLIASIPSELDRVEKECIVELGAYTTGSGDHFTIDTMLYPYTNMDPEIADVLRARAESAALNAIEYANEELGFGSALYSEMVRTSAIMGLQSEENSKYRVTWSYHPDEGLVVTYTEK